MTAGMVVANNIHHGSNAYIAVGVHSKPNGGWPPSHRAQYGFINEYRVNMSGAPTYFNEFSLVKPFWAPPIGSLPERCASRLMGFLLDSFVSLRTHPTNPNLLNRNPGKSAGRV